MLLELQNCSNELLFYEYNQEQQDHYKIFTEITTEAFGDIHC